MDGPSCHIDAVVFGLRLRVFGQFPGLQDNVTNLPPKVLSSAPTGSSLLLLGLLPQLSGPKLSILCRTEPQASKAGAQHHQRRMPSDAQDLKRAPAPWQCTAQVYSLLFYSGVDGESIKDLSAVAYSPLERASYFASPEAGRLAGGLGGLMILRYTASPVGPYDELLIIPGSYVYHVQQQGGLSERRNMRISRIYVSQKHTLFNGRYSEYRLRSSSQVTHSPQVDLNQS